MLYHQCRLKSHKVYLFYRFTYNKVIHNINCLNIGNDYVYKTRTIEKFIFEV